MSITINLTDKELIIAKVFATTSTDCCGFFDNDENLSYCNDRDLAEETGMSRHQVAGLLGSLEKKGIIQNTQSSARGDSCNDYIGEPEMYKEHPELAAFVTNNY